MDAIPPYDPSFDFDDNIQLGIENEAFGDEDMREFPFGLGFGSSPLTTPPSSAPPSRSTSPGPAIPENPASAEELLVGALAGNSRTRRNKEKGKKMRKANRKNLERQTREGPYQFDERLLEKFVKPANPTETSRSAENFPINSTGYTAPRDEGGRVFKLLELLENMGFKLEKWDGKTSRPIRDALLRIVAVLVGQPNDDGAVHKGALQAIASAQKKIRIPKGKASHRRGKFAALNWGISHGGGQKRPGNLRHNSKNSAALSALTNDPYIGRLAGFASRAFLTWAPKLYRYYEEHFEALLKHDPSLLRNFENSIWASFAVNFGPQTVCRPHPDYANLPFGWCSITALGDFNAQEGGHLVLWDLKLVIEFPPGSTVLIPSAAITHSNVPISKTETRYSFTQYSAGGLFRWVDQGFQPSDDYLASLTPDGMARHFQRQEERCSLGASLFSTLDSIPVDQNTRMRAL